uniref:Kinase domain-containing protein n=1 Tax=Loa loa TaxID=7209 RepID=A0A1I7VSJ6_LOALO
MRLVFTSWETGCKEIYTKGWKILADSIVSTSRDVVIYHGDILALEDGTVYIYTPSGTKKPYLTETSFSSSRFISFHAAYGKLFLVSEEGRLFGCGHTNYGECGVISPDPIKSLREIELVAPLAICPHGSSVTITESLKVRLVQASASEVCVIDFHGQLWNYGGGKLEFDSLGRVQVRSLQLASRRKVLQLCAGRKHFVCLAVPLIDGKKDTDVENSPTLGIQRSNKCEKCREEYELRLSTLMYMADQENELPISFVSCGKELPMKASFTIQNACLLLDTDNSHSEHQTLPRCSSSRPTSVKPSKRTSFVEYEMTEMKNVNIWDGLGKNSTFVSIENLPDMYYMQNTNTKDLPNYIVHNVSPSKLDGRVSLIESQDDPNLLPEIWTWGANENGQLGHGDLAMRRVPFKIVDSSSMYCIKVAAGDDHTIALTGTGKLYVWGSNSDGQLKQANLSHVTKPTLFKVGNHSFVLDAFASGSQTGIIVGGAANFATLYLCGSNTTEKSPQSLSLPKEIGWPGWILIADKNLAVGVHESISEIDEHLLRVFIFFRYTEFVQRISQMCQKMHERSYTVNNSPLSKLLNKLTLSSVRYSTQMFRLMKMVRDNLCETGRLSIGKLLKTHIKKYFMNALFQFHADFVECLAYGCFTELDIGEELDEEVNKMCLYYDIGGNNQGIRLRQLFQLVFNYPCKLVDLKAAGIDNNLEVSGSTQNILPSRDDIFLAEWKSYWISVKYQLDHLGTIADNTYHFWKCAPTHARSLKQAARLLLWKAENKQLETAGVINVYGNSTWTTVRRGWLTVAVFNDAVAVIERQEVIVLNFPLVWIEVNEEEGNECLVRVFGPENKFHIRFTNIECKNVFLHAMRQWKHFDQRYTTDDILKRCATELPERRRGYYKFSSHHPDFGNCTYDGYWLYGKPHGRGHLVHMDKWEYRGHFADGRLEGFGKMSIVIGGNSHKVNTYFGAKEEGTSEVDIYTGFWRNGCLDGLAHITFSNGDTYEGYMQKGLRHGYGVFHASKGDQTEIYFGGWQAGMRSGYGVSTSNKERYLGMWKNDSRHGKGTLIGIEGVYQEGQFDSNRLVRGRLMLSAADGYSGVAFEGDFEKAGIACGKGTLYLNQFDRVEGRMTGDIINGEVKINNATYWREKPVLLTSFSLDNDVPPTEIQWTTDAELKWKELFQSFLVYDLGIPVHIANAADVSEVADDACRVAVWNSLASSMVKIRLGMNKEEIKITFDENLEKIPQYTLQWSNKYYEMVQQYWNLALRHKYHPLRRLVFGLFEVFTGSYGAFGTHRAVCRQAVCELRSIHSRIYSVMRLLFSNLPRTFEMFAPIPCIDNNLGSENIDPDSQLAEDKSITKRSEEVMSFRISLLYPSCNFIVETLFSECYAVIFTLYSVNCADLDRRYWERVIYLNAFTDVKLLAYLELNRDLWPVNTENVDDLDMSLIRTTARKKFYKSAIQALQKISSHSNPMSKLAALADTFMEIGMRLRKEGGGGWSQIKRGQKTSGN